MLAVWRVCRRDEETLLVNNRQMMCVIGLVRKEWIVVMTRNSLLFFVDKRRCLLENQNTVSIEAVMSGIVIIGDYELMEKQKEGYETN